MWLKLIKRKIEVQPKAFCLFIIIVTASFSLKAQEKKPSIDFDNLRLTGGSIVSDVKNKPGGTAIGFATEYTVDKYLLGTTGEFNLDTKKFSSITFDCGGGVPMGISNDMDFFFGISALSINLNEFGGGPLNTALLLKLRFKKLVFESKTTVWDWQKGKDPVLKENGYYGISYIIYKDFAAGFQYKLYAEGAQYLNVHVGLLF